MPRSHAGMRKARSPHSQQSNERRGDLSGYHLLPASKAALLVHAGRNGEAADAYRAALALATNSAERRYLERRLRETITKNPAPS